MTRAPARRASSAVPSSSRRRPPPPRRPAGAPPVRPVRAATMDCDDGADGGGLVAGRDATATVRPPLASASGRVDRRRDGGRRRRPRRMLAADRHGCHHRSPGRVVRDLRAVPVPAPDGWCRIDGGPRFGQNRGHHPERLRDRAQRRRGNQSEIRPATGSRNRTRCQCPSDEETAVDFVSGLRCRECGRAYPAEALHVCDYCFGPLEVTYDYERRGRHHDPGADRGGPAVDLALRRPAARCTTPPRSTWAPGSPRWSGPTGWPPSSGSASCGSRTTPPTRPDRSRTGWCRWP